MAVLLTCKSLVCKGWECENEGVDRVSCADFVGGCASWGKGGV
jgi:hypothetical protein